MKIIAVDLLYFTLINIFIIVPVVCYVKYIVDNILVKQKSTGFALYVSEYASKRSAKQ